VSGSVEKTSSGSTDTYVLDSSALLAYLTNEPGTDQVGDLLEQAKRRRCRVLIPFMVFMETCYRIWQLEGEEAAKRTFADLSHLPVQRVDVEERSLWLACEMKAVHRLSVGDAWVLAIALAHKAILVHKDPDFEPLSHLVNLVSLPYKR
jgi:predicted nucleic acid-binding protein